MTEHIELDKALFPILGANATVLLLYLCESLETGYNTFAEEDGTVWHRQNYEWLSYHTTLPRYTAIRAKNLLEREGLIETKQADEDRTNEWRIIEDKFKRLLQFATMLRLASKPDNERTFPAWEAWKKENSGIVKSFAHLVRSFPKPTMKPAQDGDFGKVTNCNHEPLGMDFALKGIKHLQDISYSYEKLRFSSEYVTPLKRRLEKNKNIFYGQGEESGKENQTASKGASSVLAQKKREARAKAQAKEEKEQSDLNRPSRFVDYWNTLPHVPKCKIGTKAYYTARKFFSAYRRYEAGISVFVLPESEQKRLRIFPKQNSSDRRTDKEIFEHIRTAALAYDPQYAPTDKTWLRNLANFTFRIFGKNCSRVSRSPFLEFVAFPPKHIEITSAESLLENAGECEYAAFEAIQELYNQANGYDADHQLSLTELKKALAFARSYREAHKTVPAETNARLAHHIGTFQDFLSEWKRFAKEHIWEGMPLGAFARDKDIWRKWVAWENSNMGYNIFTGEKIERQHL